MTAKEIVKKIMEMKGISITEFGRRLGTNRSTMWDRLNSKKKMDLSVNMLVKLLQGLGYKLVIMPVNEQNPNGSYLVESHEKEE